jgi:ABC-type multidrug transport system ATPase subunit
LTAVFFYFSKEPNKMIDKNAYSVDVHQLSRKFKDFQVLDRVSLSLEHGTACGLIGRNGAGKTTFLKHLVGLYRAQEGSVRVIGGIQLYHLKLRLPRLDF